MAANTNSASADTSEIEKALESLHLHSGSNAQAAQAVSILADASKTDLSARKQMADPQILKALIETVDLNLNESLEVTDLALRCIGNASIDNNEAREALTSIGFSWASSCLYLPGVGEPIRPTSDLKTHILTAKVLYNICCDYESAQKRCCQEHIYDKLMHLLSYQQVVDSDDKTLIIELLFWVCSQKESESTVAHPLPEHVHNELLMLPRWYYESVEVNDFAMLEEICLMFLREAQVQRRYILDKQVSRIMNLLRFNEEKIAQVDEEDKKLLIPVSTSLIWCLSDLAALPEFSQTYTPDDDLIKWNMIDLLKTSTNAQFRLLTAACQMLGNFLWAQSDPTSFAYFVETDSIHNAAIAMLVSSQDPESMHAAAGLLIQLSRVPQTREAIGSASDAHRALRLLCEHETPQLKDDGIKLLRSLGRECPGNQERFADLAKDVVVQAAAEQPGGDTNMIQAPA